MFLFIFLSCWLHVNHMAVRSVGREKETNIQKKWMRTNVSLWLVFVLIASKLKKKSKWVKLSLIYIEARHKCSQHLCILEKQSQPPSYSEVYPTAPLMPGDSPTHNSQQANSGWNPNINQQYPQQYPVMSQPMINQPQTMHQQLYQQPQQSMKCNNEFWLPFSFSTLISLFSRRHNQPTITTRRKPGQHDLSTLQATINHQNRL